MTVVGDILWPAAFAYAVWRFAAVAERWAPAAPDVAPEPEDVEVPDDLVALALTHSETWAQEDTLKAMRERYADLKDWQKVRFAFGIGRIDG
jgi:hypothetical protein